MYRYLLKPILFLFPPEKAHNLTLQLFKLALSVPIIGSIVRHIYRRRGRPVNVAGLTFPNRIGLAAGFDKDGKYMNLMSNLGFGFLEIGTVTPLAQAGNPQPRLFRLPEDQGLINRMGFNNDGLEAMVTRLKDKRPNNIIIGANIGKNKVTPNEQAHEDYEACFRALHHLVDYFVVNVSSPNTPGLRALQEKGPLLFILKKLKEINQGMTQPKPIFLKIAPDLNESQLNDIVEIVVETDIAGVVATNTTISRNGLSTDPQRIEEIGAGGLSGSPVFQRSNEVLRHLRETLPASKAIIGVGGICSAEDARTKLAMGADLVQVYSGLIYAGPALVKDIARL